MRFFYLLASSALIVLFFQGCTTVGKGPGDRSNASLKAKPVSLYLTANRSGELEPCGCTVAPMGGVERELNYINQTKDKSRDTLFVSAGTTFISRRFNPIYREAAVEKAKAVTLAMNLVGTDVVSPSLEDMRFTQKEWESISQTANFALVSSNLLEEKTGKPIFKPSFTHWNNGYAIVFLGVTEGLTESHSWVKLGDPLTSLKNEIKNLPPAPRMVILLSSLSTETREKIVKQLPEIDLVLGGYGDRESSGRYLSKKQIYLNPMGLARSSTKIDFDPLMAFNDVYVPRVSMEASLQLDRLIRQSKENETELSKRNTPRKRRQVLKAINQNLAMKMEKLKRVPAFISAKSLVVSVETEYLDSQYNGKDPRLEAILSNYKNSLKSLALKDQIDPETREDLQGEIQGEPGNAKN